MVRWTARAFLSAYIQTADRPSLVPKDRDELPVLLDALLMEKAMYEVGYELNNLPGCCLTPSSGKQPRDRARGSQIDLAKDHSL